MSTIATKVEERVYVLKVEPWSALEVTKYVLFVHTSKIYFREQFQCTSNTTESEATYTSMHFELTNGYYTFMQAGQVEAR